MRLPHNPMGLSPRGRGKLPSLGIGVRRGGSIPAWAGETKLGGFTSGKVKVYPRVGGGNDVCLTRYFVT